MTTIVCVPSQGIMLSDSQASKGDFCISYRTEKITEIARCLVGIAGRYSSGEKFKTWFREVSDSSDAKINFPSALVDSPPDLCDADFQALVLYPDKTLVLFESGSHYYELKEMDYHAIGSGADIAISSMDTMQETISDVLPHIALSVAIKRDIFSGGDIQAHTLCEDGEGVSAKDIVDMPRDELIKLIGGEDFLAEVEAIKSSKEESDVG